MQLDKSPVAGRSFDGRLAVVRIVGEAIDLPVDAFAGGDTLALASLAAAASRRARALVGSVAVSSLAFCAFVFRPQHRKASRDQGTRCKNGRGVEDTRACARAGGDEKQRTWGFDCCPAALLFGRRSRSSTFRDNCCAVSFSATNTFSVACTRAAEFMISGTSHLRHARPIRILQHFAMLAANVRGCKMRRPGIF